MKFYYVALTINKEQPVSVRGGRKLAYYTKKYPAIKQCDNLNELVKIWRKENNSPNTQDFYKVYCVESEPTEVTSD